MSNYFARRGSAYKNQFNQCYSELTGISEGLIADRHLNDAEIQFLNQWLEKHSAIALDWPGDVIHAKVKAVLQDGIVTEDERTHLIKTLEGLVGGRLDNLAEGSKVNQLVFDDVAAIAFSDALFCLTGDFVYAPRPQCEAVIVSKGGRVSASITRKLNYLIVGGLGSDEWKHSGWGTKIDKAMEYKHAGVPIAIVKEAVWTSSL